MGKVKNLLSFLVLLTILISSLGFITNVAFASDQSLGKNIPKELFVAPEANDDVFITPTGTPLSVPAPGVLANDLDLDSPVLTATLQTDAVYGSLVLYADGAFVYTPTFTFSLVDSFTYIASDGVLTDTAIVTLIMNDPPLGVNDTFTTTEDVPLMVNAPGVLGNDSDPNGDPLVGTLGSSPAHGAVALSTNGAFIYTPTLNYRGADSFTYLLSDGIFTTTASVNLTTLPAGITAFPRIGVGPLDVTFTNLSDDPTSLSILDYGDGVTETITTTQIHTYSTPGVYTVTLTLQDGNGAYTVVYPGHVAVYATGSSSVYYVDALNGIDSPGNGVETAPWKTITYALDHMFGTPLELRVASGTYDQALGEIFPIVMKAGIHIGGVGAPFANVAGISTQPVFSFPNTALYDANTILSGFKITGGNSGVKVDGFTGIAVTPVIRENWIAENTYGIHVDTINGRIAKPLVSDNRIFNNSLHGLYLSSVRGISITEPDLESNVIVSNTGSGVYCYASGVGYPHHNDYGLCNPTLTNNLIANNSGDGFTCHTSYTGGCSAILTANVIADNSGWGWGRIFVNAYLISTKPEFYNNLIYGNAGGGAKFVNWTSDQEKDAPIFINNTIAFNGPFGIQDGHPTIINNIVWGHTSDLNAAVSAVSYSDVSQGPYAGQNNNVSINPQFVDQIEGDYHLLPTSPVIDLGNNNAPDLPATDIDGDPRIDGVTVDMGADEVQLSPHAQDDAFETTEDVLSVSLDVLSNDNDPTGSPLTIFSVGNPISGQTSISGTLILYTPSENFNGQDVFTYIIQNDVGRQDLATVTVQILPVNDAPVALQDTFVVSGTVLQVGIPGVLGNDTDIDNDPLTVSLDNPPAHGTIVLSENGSFVYTPTLNYVGTDLFTYQVSDGVLTDTASVNLTITATNNPPLVSAGPDQVAQEGEWVQFVGSYIDPGYLEEQGTPSILWDFGDGFIATGTLTSSHLYADNGIYTVTLTITDTEGNAGHDSLIVTVINEAPLVEDLPDQSLSVGENLILTIHFTDTGWLDTHIVEIVWMPGVTETLDLAPGVYSFSLEHVFTTSGVYSITITLTDNDGSQSVQTFVVTVTGVESGYIIYLPTVRR